MRRICMWMCGLVALGGFAAGLDEVVAPGTVAKKLVGGFIFTEGATVDAKGEVFFTDQPNDRIYRWTEKDGLRVFMAASGRANGMCFAPDGSLLVCADYSMELRSVRPNGEWKVIAKGFEGKDFNGPNDVWACPQGGGCYFTDPFYKRTWWRHQEPPQGSRQVYYLPKDGKPVRVTTDLVQPNGIVGTPDGKTLYVADIDARKVYVYAIQPDGSLADRKLFCEEASDGMTIDADGRLYLANQNVSVYSPKGEKLGVIPIPEGWCGNLCIGGPGKDPLYVTASKGFYAVPLKVKGSNQGK
ncbi:MAG: SMP-30/gluconolactonase/LRE family protein [Kiritimatiellae bacterium]|nr:SMP-30/gluconolactonase/LRE family protein [Kiritimatiellia bacterium]